MERIHYLFLVLPVILLAGKPLHATELPPGADFQSLTQWMELHNPQVQVMQSQADAARARASIAGALPDPMFRLELMDIDRREPRLQPGQRDQTWYTVSQTFPLWGKLSKQEAAAAAETDIAGAQLKQTLAELNAMLRMSYAGYYAAFESTRINQSILALLDTMEIVVQTRYANGVAAQQDIIKIQAERTMLQSELVLLAGEKRRMQISINSLLVRDVNADLAPPLGLPVVDITQISQNTYAATALSGSPSLQAAKASILVAQSNREIANRQRYPDLTVGVTAVQEESSLASWQLMFEINLPFQFAKRKAWISEASAIQASALASHDAQYLKLSAMVAQALSDFQTAEAQEKIFVKQLLPQVTLAFRAAIASYENGKVDFDALIEAERQIRQARLSALSAAINQQKAIAQLVQFTGAKL